MSIEAGLRAHLASVSSRIYPANLIPEAAPLPSITYRRVSTTPQIGLGGLAGLTSVRVQISVFAEGDSGYGEAKELAAAVIARLSGFRGAWGDVPISGVNFDGMQDIDHDAETGVCGVDMDFIIWHRGSVP